jgi:hypothetical protein
MKWLHIKHISKLDNAKKLNIKTHSDINGKKTDSASLYNQTDS